MHSLSLFRAVLAALLMGVTAQAADDCRRVAEQINKTLGHRLDSAELADTLSALNRDGRLPARFVTKREATAAGWKPGRSLWSVDGMDGKSIGGDRFGNFEGRLPKGNWREADLDYHGGKRGPDRLVFEPQASGRRYVTVDHYQQFTEVPPCR
ncbi:ribonuclease domain-containing protein [Chitinimonas lacunae]|uniref:Ribonuclease domain-containing protein n=1 Tax=Chitinimonas lacunae TaxID=1963018 RepID=A0ABV8MTZ5_9NEIS